MSGGGSLFESVGKNGIDLRYRSAISVHGDFTSNEAFFHLDFLETHLFKGRGIAAELAIHIASDLCGKGICYGILLHRGSDVRTVLGRAMSCAHRSSVECQHRSEPATMTATPSQNGPEMVAPSHSDANRQDSTGVK